MLLSPLWLFCCLSGQLFFGLVSSMWIWTQWNVCGWWKPWSEMPQLPSCAHARKTNKGVQQDGTVCKLQTHPKVTSEESRTRYDVGKHIWHRTRWKIFHWISMFGANGEWTGSMTLMPVETPTLSSWLLALAQTSPNCWGHLGGYPRDGINPSPSQINKFLNAWDVETWAPAPASLSSPCGFGRQLSHSQNQLLYF